MLIHTSMENFDLYIRDIAASLKTMSAGAGSEADLSTIETKLGDIATQLEAVVTKLNAIDGHLNPIYTAEYTAPEAGE